MIIIIRFLQLKTDYAYFLCIVFWSQYGAAVLFNLMLFLISQILHLSHFIDRMVVYPRGSRNGHYQYFHYFCILMALSYNLGSACVVPYSYFHLCWIPLAPCNNNTIIIKITFLLWLSGFEWTLIAVTTGFPFRYALISSPFIPSFFIQPCRWPLIIILLLVTYSYTAL